MRIKTMGFIVAAGLMAVAPQAYAFGGGGGGGGSDPTSGTFTGTCTGNQCSGTVTTSDGTTGTVDGTGTFTPDPVSAAEPLSLLAVGVGLLGARYLRRRR